MQDPRARPDDAKAKARLEAAMESLGYFDITEADERLLRRARELLEPCLDGVIEEFYAHLARFPSTRVLLTSEERVARLKETQRAYLRSLGDFEQRNPGSVAKYVATRLSVGLTHWRVGLPPPVYIGAYAKLGHLLMQAVGSVEKEEPLPLILCLQKVLHLDSHLAMEAYEQARYDEALAEAEIDPVTDLPTRRMLVQRLREELARANRFGHTLSLLFIDADRFKEVNDRHGHDAGDAVLRAIAARARAAIRPADLLGRYGGDEFVIGLVETDSAEAWRIGLRIQKSLSAGDVDGIQVTVSVGVASSTGEGELEELIASADRAMYDAKSQGRNSVSSHLKP